MAGMAFCLLCLQQDEYEVFNIPFSIWAILNLVTAFFPFLYHFHKQPSCQFMLPPWLQQ